MGGSGIMLNKMEPGGRKRNISWHLSDSVFENERQKTRETWVANSYFQWWMVNWKSNPNNPFPPEGDFS